MADSIEKLLLLLLGWLLGLLAPVIADSIKRAKENRLGQAAIKAELRDASHKIALAAHLIYMRKGVIDRDHLSWMEHHLNEYKSLLDTDSVLKSIKLQQSWPDDTLKAYALSTEQRAGKGLTLQKYAVPLLDSRVAAMWSFSNELQRHLLQIRTEIDLLNALVDRAERFTDKTFTKLENGNYDLVIGNIEQCYDQYFDRAKSIVERVEKLTEIE